MTGGQKLALGLIAGGVALLALSGSSSARPVAASDKAPTPPAPPAPPTLLTLLRTSQLARQVFNVQALAWSLGMTRYEPDGRYGPLTLAMINDAERIITGSNLTTRFEPEALITIQAAGRIRRAFDAPPRLLPMYLPPDVVQALNRDALAISPEATLIQARTATA